MKTALLHANGLELGFVKQVDTQTYVWGKGSLNQPLNSLYECNSILDGIGRVEMSTGQRVEQTIFHNS